MNWLQGAQAAAGGGSGVAGHGFVEEHRGERAEGGVKGGQHLNGSAETTSSIRHDLKLGT